jgi:hypothetical protein
VIQKREQHQTDRTDKRLLRESLEPPGWVVNYVEEDYGIASNVQVFDGKSPSGAWFHVQIKSSACTPYSSDRSFVSQDLPIAPRCHSADRPTDTATFQPHHGRVQGNSLHATQLSYRDQEPLDSTCAEFKRIHCGLLSGQETTSRRMARDSRRDSRNPRSPSRFCNECSRNT